jgi:hypothetical protein
LCDGLSDETEVIGRRCVTKEKKRREAQAIAEIEQNENDQNSEVLKIESLSTGKSTTYVQEVMSHATAKFLSTLSISLSIQNCERFPTK